MTESSVNADPQETLAKPSCHVTVHGEQAPIDIYTEAGFRRLTDLWVMAGWQRKLSYEPTWLGVPIIQLPEDVLMMQELIYKMRPGVIVETGVAHGGSAIFYASILELLGRGCVVAIDIEIRKYNRLVIQSHPQSHRIRLVEGDSTSAETLKRVRAFIPDNERVLVALDSNHARDHVLRELEMYSPLIAPGGYIVVFDTVMDILADAPDGHPDWRVDGAGAAVRSFLESHDDFQVDTYYGRLGATYCTGGFLRRVDASDGLTGHNTAGDAPPGC